MSSISGGFSGDNALLAFAAVQQGRMNDELTESMRAADIRSQMAKDLASLKAHWDGANRDYAPGTDEKHVKVQGFVDLNKEIQAFIDKYGADPACADLMPAIHELEGSVELHLHEWEDRLKANAGNLSIPKYSDADVEKIKAQLQETLDAAGTNDQLAMIHIKQLNDNINNSSGMVSGIMDSRQNTTASIINNIA